MTGGPQKQTDQTPETPQEVFGRLGIYIYYINIVLLYTILAKVWNFLLDPYRPLEFSTCFNYM